MSLNSKSDVIAKNAYMKKLKSQGYKNVRVTSKPSDIQATKDGKDFYFEIKSTTKEKKYFGSATLTEWESAMKNKDRYYFVVAILKNNEWIFTEYTCDEFMQFSNIPPYKIYFNIPDTLVKSIPTNKKSKSIALTSERLRSMICSYKKLAEKTCDK